jgi:catechol 2,3-dioxygenase-like lactoylglutathione lyase family enzyme
MTAVKLTALHHVQLAMPKGRETDSRAFYQGVLGRREVLKPAGLTGRGGSTLQTLSATG